MGRAHAAVISGIANQLKLTPRVGANVGQNVLRTGFRAFNSRPTGGELRKMLSGCSTSWLQLTPCVGGANEHDNVGVLTQNVFNSRPPRGGELERDLGAGENWVLQLAPLEGRMKRRQSA